MEDARAAMDLALLKFERGPAYAAGGGERGDKLAEVLNDAGRWAECGICRVCRQGFTRAPGGQAG